uniref:Ovule protein n=1 Tax=Heterorhabditis bacteriophora TaxID=37862 RepID=A0A1I7XKP8_HETBA
MSQSTPFPTLLSSIHGKLMFRKHTTPLPKANYSEILEESPTVSPTETQHING